MFGTFYTISSHIIVDIVCCSWDRGHVLHYCSHCMLFVGPWACSTLLFTLYVVRGTVGMFYIIVHIVCCSWDRGHVLHYCSHCMLFVGPWACSPLLFTLYVVRGTVGMFYIIAHIVSIHS